MITAEYLAAESWAKDDEGNFVAPAPDKVIFLDMPIEVSQKLLTKRYEGDENKKDIHESDVKYLEKCRNAACFTAKYSGWSIINCAESGEARSIEDIAKDVLAEALSVYGD